MADGDMNVTERRKDLQKMRARYRGATRAGPGQLLTEMAAVTGLHRQSLLRVLGQATLARQPRQRQRTPTYGLAIRGIVTIVWASLDYSCAERLPPALLPMARQLATFGECRLTPALEQQLATISRATVQRMLSRLSTPKPRLPQRGPERANQLRAAVPMGRMSWERGDPGHFAVDLVQHSGSSATGAYLYTLQMVDIATGWSARVARLGRSQHAMEAGFRRILGRLPFTVRGLHPDNGSEFCNHHLCRFFGEELVDSHLSRSRPYHKNDKRNVEQKNSSLVRATIGYGRLDTAAQCAALNAIYEDRWLYYNLFPPVLQLIAKEVRGGKRRRKWDTATPPYQRVRATNILTNDWQATLDAPQRQTNPRRLRQQIQEELHRLWRLPNAAAMAAD
jgi:hypothetical protein